VVNKDFNMSIADASPEYLKNWDLGANISNEKAPILQRILHSAAQKDVAKEKNKIKDPHTIRVTCLFLQPFRQRCHCPARFAISSLLSWRMHAPSVAYTFSVPLHSSLDSWVFTANN
jgi:hypothetical protein